MTAGYQPKGSPLGYCPVCGARGDTRERRINGNDRCSEGHEYPSSTALSALPNPPSGGSSGHKPIPTMAFGGLMAPTPEPLDRLSVWLQPSVLLTNSAPPGGPPGNIQLIDVRTIPSPRLPLSGLIELLERTAAEIRRDAKEWDGLEGHRLLAITVHHVGHWQRASMAGLSDAYRIEHHLTFEPREPAKAMGIGSTRTGATCDAEGNSLIQHMVPDHIRSMPRHSFTTDGNDNPDQ